MAIEQYSGLDLDTTIERVGPGSVRVISRSGLGRFLAESRSLQERLVSVPVQERLEVLDAFGIMLEGDLREGKFEGLIEGLATSTGYSERLISGELAFIPSVLSSGSLMKCLRSSMVGAPSSLEGFTEIGENEHIWHLPVGPALIVSSGNSIIPTIVPTVISVLTGNATILRPSRSNCAGVVGVFRILDRLHPSVARDAIREALAVSYYAHDSPVLRFALSEAQFGVINFWGGGLARSSIKRMVDDNPHRPRFFVNGPMTGMALIDAASANDENAGGLALNVALYNQQLCSSPTIVLFEGNINQAIDYAIKVASNLDVIGSAMPMESDAVDAYSLHGARRFLQVKGSKVFSSKDAANPWTIAVSEGRSLLDGMVSAFPAMNIHGRKRFIEIVVLDSIEKGFELITSLPASKAFEGIDRVQSVGIAISEGKMEQVKRRLALMGVYRTVPIPGMFMNPPPNLTMV